MHTSSHARSTCIRARLLAVLAVATLATLAAGTAITTTPAGASRAPDAQLPPPGEPPPGQNLLEGAWIGTGTDPSENFGWSITTAGDVNADGYSDLIVASPTHDSLRGRVRVYHGSPDGLPATAAWMLDGTQVFLRLGWQVAAAGDVNGDGFDDILIGTDPAPGIAVGLVHLFAGSAAGLGAEPAWTAQGNLDEGFGRAVAGAGDVNGDGFDDILVGIPYSDVGGSSSGEIHLYLGAASGPATSPAWTAAGSAGDLLGWSVSLSGDVNADGFDDVLVGATGEASGRGAAHVFLGSATVPSATPDWTVTGDTRISGLGRNVSLLGDVNGDGYSDVTVAARSVNGAGDGAVLAYHGSASGPSSTANWTKLGPSLGEFGEALGPAGDVNGDGYADVIIGAPSYANPLNDEGAAYVYLGSEGGLLSSPYFYAEGEVANVRFGQGAYTAGDVNGDGFSDIAVGAPFYTVNVFQEGRAAVWHGAPDGLTLASTWSTEPNQNSAFYGRAAAFGDFNADGYSDLAVGAPFYNGPPGPDSGRAWLYHGRKSGYFTVADQQVDGGLEEIAFGYSLDSADDVNGDGYDDLIVGAIGNEVNVGRAFLFLGGFGGIELDPEWTVVGSERQYGRSVGSAGDVNGDGYADVIIGSPDEGAGGRAYVYHGSMTGLSMTPDWTVDGPSASDFGSAVAGAGDVNGDGFSDVIVGAPGYTNGQNDEGGAFVYLGSSNGLATSAAWSMETDQAGAEGGSAVDTAGDTDGDGYSDVIVGARAEDFILSNAGVVRVYFGSATGLETSAGWTRAGTTANGLFGWAVGTGGDVNSDGYSEILIGEPSYPDPQTGQGRAHLFLGSSRGPETTADWMVTGAQSDARFGEEVAGAGDVSGDGFGDVVIGAPEIDLGQNDEGAVYLYDGNNGAGLTRLPRQRQPSNTAAIAILGRAEENAFRVLAHGRTPRGRDGLRLAWEAKQIGQAFNGNGVETSGVYDTGVPIAGLGSRALMDEPVIGLIEDRLYHWRLRLTSRSPYFPRSPWLALAGNNRTEMDLRAGSVAAAINDGSDGGGESGAGVLPASLVLMAAQPNPFNPSTRIAFELPARGRAVLSIYDALGRLVARPFDGVADAGRHAVQWEGRAADGRPLPSGVYYYEIESGGERRRDRMVLAR